MKEPQESQPSVRCPRCDQPLAADVPGRVLSGHCPKCLVRTSLLSGSDGFAPLPDGPLSFLRSFGDYELLDEIARGGMGVVYRARQHSLNRIVALKMLLAGEFASADFVRRFRQEAEAAASLRHPNIVAIHEVGQRDGQHFFTMELVEGCNLATLVRDGPLSPLRAAGFLKTITEAVAFAHARGIIHRDLKPSNILIDPFGQPRITDFGLARQLQAEGELTRTGQALGSPAYMAPEQASGRGQLGPAADLYSLGALLYHLITGRPPFQSDTIAATLVQVQQEPPLPPRRLNSSIPEDLQTICLKCLEKEPARRYASARELADDLDFYLRGEPIRARPRGAAEKLWLWSRRRPAIAALSVVVGLLLLILVIGSPVAAWRISHARSAENRARAKAESANQELRSANQRLGEAVSSLELQRAEDFFHGQDASFGVGQLAAMLRENPSNQLAATRLVSALVHRDWALPFVSAPGWPAAAQMIDFAPDGERVLMVGLENSAHVRNSRTGQQLFALTHAGRIPCARFSPDGRWIVTASFDGTARIWDASNGAPVGEPLRHAGKVCWAEFSPGSGKVVTAGADRTARLWTASGKLQVTVPNHDSAVIRAHFAPDGKSFATVTETGGIRLWDSESGVFQFELKGHEAVVNGLAFSPDGRRVAAACNGGNAWLWDLGQTLPKPLPHSFWGPPVWHVAFSPDSQLLLTTAEDSTVRLWNASDGFPRGQPFLHEGGVVFGAFSPDGEKLVTASSDNSARLWEWRNGQPFGQPLRHLTRVRYAAFSPDGHRLVTSSMGDTAHWDISARRIRAIEIRHPNSTTSVDFHARDETLLTTCLDGTARVWHSRDGHPVDVPLKLKSPLNCGRFSPNGQLALVGCADGSAVLWQLAGGSIAGTVSHSNAVLSVRFSPDGSKFVTTSADGTARVWDAATTRPLTPSMHHSGPVLMAAFSSDAKRVVTASEDWSARVWDAETGMAITAPLRHIAHVKWAEFSPDGTRVVTASTDNSACIWDISTSRPAIPPLYHARIVEMALFSTDGRRVVTVSQDRTARIWDSQTGQALTPPLKHESAVTHVAFSPDGSRVLTGGWNGFVRVWDLQTGRPLTEWLFGGGNISALAFDPTGQRIASGSQNGFALVWDVPVPPTPVPHWFATFAETVAGLRMNERRNVEPIARTDVETALRELGRHPAADFYTRLARWFLADPGQRPASPFSGG